MDRHHCCSAVCAHHASKQRDSVFNLWLSIWWTKPILRNDQKESIVTKTTQRIHLYIRQTKRLNASRIFARGKERFRLGMDTKQKGACQPRTLSQFLYNSSLAAHMLTVFKTSLMNIKTTNNNGQHRDNRIELASRD